MKVLINRLYAKQTTSQISDQVGCTPEQVQEHIKRTRLRTLIRLSARERQRIASNYLKAV